MHRWLDSFEGSFCQSELNFVKNCGIESETDFVLIQTFWQFWVRNDPNHYAFAHIIGYQTRYPFNAIAHLNFAIASCAFLKSAFLFVATFCWDAISPAFCQRIRW